jgi:hypothetical protein
MANANIRGAFGLDFAEQIAFFEQKLSKGSRRWNQLADGTPIMGAAHDTTFIVAGAMKADLLDDLRGAVDKAIQKGTGLEEFRKDFRRIVTERGWHGWTGEGTKAGEAWRTHVIWETNLATSYAAGHYAQLTDPELLARRPYWKYVHSESVLHPRPQHLAWNGLTLRHDHPFWKTHYPPNGWGCQCRVIAVRGPEDGDRTKPPEGWDKPDDKGRMPGIDKGWNYAPGASRAEELRKIVAEKAAKLPALIGAALGQDTAPVLLQSIEDNLAHFVQQTAKSMLAKGESALAHIVHPDVVTRMAALDHPMATADVLLTDDVLLHAIRDAKINRRSNLPLTTWENLPKLMEKAKVYFDSEDPALLYVFTTGSTPANEVEKVVIRVNYTEQTRPAGTKGKRTKITTNFIRTGGYVDVYNIENESRYVRLGKK